MTKPPETHAPAVPDPRRLEDPPRYTIGPNPYLAEFVATHRTTDEREPPPAYTRTIKASKASPLYNMHTYWSKKPHEAIETYIRHYTRPGDLVLDPFSGSGGTAVAALMNGRKAIAIDLSPAATFISYHYTHPVDPARLRAAYNRLMERVGPELEWLYATTLDGSLNGEPAQTAYTVYSAAFECKECSSHVVVYNAPTVHVAKLDLKGRPITKDGRPVIDEKQQCPSCGFTFTTRELGKFKSLPSVPVKVSVKSRYGGKRVERTLVHRQAVILG